MAAVAVAVGELDDDGERVPHPTRANATAVRMNNGMGERHVRCVKAGIAAPFRIRSVIPLATRDARPETATAM